MGFLTAFGSVIGVYIMGMAVLSPCPLLVNHMSGAILIVSFLFHKNYLNEAFSKILNLLLCFVCGDLERLPNFPKFNYYLHMVISSILNLAIPKVKSRNITC